MPRKDTTPREGRAGTAFNAKYVAAMERIEDMSVRRALGSVWRFAVPCAAGSIQGLSIKTLSTCGSIALRRATQGEGRHSDGGNYRSRRTI